MSKTRVYEWYKDFKSDRTVIEDLPQPTNSNKNVNNIVVENCHTSLREIDQKLGVSYGTTQLIVVEILCMRCATFWLVPTDINFVQIQRRKLVEEDMISKANDSSLTWRQANNRSLK